MHSTTNKLLVRQQCSDVVWALLVLCALQIDIQDYSLVQAIRSCVVDGTTLLALGNEQGLQVCLKQADTHSNVFRALNTILLHLHT